MEYEKDNNDDKDDMEGLYVLEAFSKKEVQEECGQIESRRYRHLPV